MNGNSNIEKIRRPRTATKEQEHGEARRDWKRKRRLAKLNSIRNHRRAA